MPKSYIIFCVGMYQILNFFCGVLEVTEALVLMYSMQMKYT